MPVADRSDALRPADRPLRLARSVTAALVCVLVAGVGHTAAGGTLAPVAAGAVLVGASAVTWALGGRRITPAQLVGLLVLCQVGVHLAAPHREMAMGAAMVAAHLAATIVSAVALAHGERFVWALAERLGLRIASSVRAAVLPVWRRPALLVIVPRVRRDVRLAHSLWSRGPPVGLV